MLYVKIHVLMHSVWVQRFARSYLSLILYPKIASEAWHSLQLETELTFWIEEKSHVKFFILWAIVNIVKLSKNSNFEPLFHSHFPHQNHWAVSNIAWKGLIHIEGEKINHEFRIGIWGKTEFEGGREVDLSKLSWMRRRQRHSLLSGSGCDFRPR